MPKFDKESYLSYVEMSSKYRLLVEGYSDKTALSYAISKLKYDDIDIDTAEDLISFNSTLGNRQKVEVICQEINDKTSINNFIGFVDREFRRFEVNEKISSEISTHYKSNNLFWTFGHSIENYTFSEKIIAKSLQYLANSPNAPKAIESYTNIFPSVLTLSTALTLTLYEKDFEMSRVISLLEWDIFEISGNEISIDLKKFDSGLKERGFSEQERNDLIDEYSKSLSIVKSSDQNSIKCFCHGHTGIRVIKSTFARCLNDHLDDGENINSVFLRISDKHLFNTLINVYYDIIKHDGTEFPSLIIDTLVNN
jgi:hypothetical protein